MKNLPSLYALDNRVVPGMEHCFGAPFIAKDFESACDMVKEALKDKKDLVKLENFYLVELLPYDITRDFPIALDMASDIPDIVCVADLFPEEEEDVPDEVAYCGTDAFEKESGITDEQE